MATPRLSRLSSSKATSYELETISPHSPHLDHDHDEDAPLSAGDPEISRFTWLVTCAAAIGGLLFGYDTGIMSGALVVIGSDLGHPLSDKERELITSITSGGAFIGALLAALLADKIGRKMVIGLGAIWFNVACVIGASAYSVTQMTVARFLLGLGVGLVAMVVPVYIGELAPSKHRGRLVTLHSVSITGGQCLSYGIAAGFSSVPNGWRYMFGLGAVPSLLLIALVPILPETPRQLMHHSHHAGAMLVLQKQYPNATEPELAAIFARIERGLSKAPPLHHGPALLRSLKQLYGDASNLRALFVACGVMAIQQLTGFNTLMYYSATLFGRVGFRDPVAVGIVVAGTNFVFTTAAVKYVDRLGRRRLLVYTIWGMSVALVVAAVAFSYIPVSDGAMDTVAEREIRWPEILVLVAIIVYVAFYATGLGNVPWQACELLPMEVRAVGTAMVTMTCWGCNIIVSATFLSLMKAITPSGAFGLYSGVCAVGWVLVICFYPEVAQMPLEEVREVFRHGFGVRYAERVRRERREREKGVVASGVGV
ncbi:general substrate transporter [Geopyxis carbonaria]|nr:general substrate transporter [Geopyxis carbonaria]